MSKLTEFIKKERLYLLLLVFVALLYILGEVAGEGKAPAAAAAGDAKAPAKAEDDFLSRPAVEKALAENKGLLLAFNLVTLLFLAVMSLGLVVDGMLAATFFSKRKMDIETHQLEKAEWNLWDVAKVVILFLFFGYMVVMIEAALIKQFPLLKDDNFRMMVNSSILDVLTVIFIIHFTVGQYREKLISLGISLRNFSRNVFYGVVGYVAAVPALVAALIVIAVVVSVTKYVPEKQPIVELFLKEESPTFLAYSSVFAAFVGPFIEELFFRGFMYGALKRYVGIFASMALTSAVFAMLHAHIVGFLPIMMLGMLLAYLYEKTGTLVAPITVHMIHNFSMVFLVFLLKQLRV